MDIVHGKSCRGTSAQRAVQAVQVEQRSGRLAFALSLIVSALAAPYAQATESTATTATTTVATPLKGIIVATRDITRPVVPAPAGAPTGTEALCIDAPVPPEPTASPPLPDQASVLAYRNTLKQTGSIAIEPGAPIDDAAEFRGALTPLLGEVIDQALLGKLTQQAVAYVNAHSRGLNDVYFPPQNAADGVLVLVVAPAKVGQVVAKGQKHVDGRDLACRIRQRHGERVDTKVIADDLAYLNRNPWRRTNVAFAPGAVPGETDIVLDTTDERPLRFSVGADNAGTRLTGLGRYRANVNWGNPFGNFDHRLDFSYVQAERAERFSQATLAYTMPLANRDTVLAYVTGSRTHVSLENGAFDSKGSNIMAGVEWSRPVGIDPSSARGAYPEIYGGFEYKRIGSTLAFGETPISDVVPEVFQGYVGYRGGWADGWGHNDIDGRLTLSPGGLSGRNSDEIFEQSRPGARSRYMRLNFSYDRYVPLPAKWQFHGRLSGQYANRPLLASEQFGMSGASRVRGFYEDTLIADSGLVANLELQTPYVSVPLGSTSGLLQGLVFVDLGRAWHKTEMTNADLDRTGKVFNLASYGVGARFNLNPSLTLRADLGWRTAGLVGRSGMFGHVSVLFAY